MLNRFPIALTAPLLIALPVLVVGVWLSVMWNSQSRHAIKQLADENIEKIHEMAATKVADELSAPARVCEVNAHLIRSGKLDPADLGAWRPTFVQQAKSFDMLSAVVWGSADGRAAWVSRYADGAYYWALKEDADSPTMTEWRLDAQGEMPAEPSGTFEFNLYSRPWFKVPRNAGKASWSAPYVWVGGGDTQAKTLGISYGIPMYEADGQLLGIVDTDLSLSDLSAFLKSIRIGKTGVAVLITNDGKLLAASDDTPLVDAEGQRVQAETSTDPRIVGAVKLLDTAGASEDKASNNEAGNVETDNNGGTHHQIQAGGQSQYVHISKIGQQIGLDWTLVTIVPEQDFLADIDREVQRSWIASLIAVAVAVVVGLAAARWLITPLIELVTAVRRIRQGDLETRVSIRHAPEYTKLGDEINEMTVGLQDRMRMRESLSLAMEVQKNLLPSEDPSLKRLDVAGHSTYCDETGGDYYDFLDVSGADEDTAMIVVGDVMGHGVAAAMLMATARGILRSRCSEPGSLADFLDHLNDMLVPDTGGHRFMTMLLLTLSTGRDQLRWASAGHGPPILYDAESDSFPELDGGGLPLGIMEGEAYEEYVQPGIRPGCLILAATDGLYEAMAEDGTAFGMDRVRQVLRENARRSAAEISDTMRDALAQFRGPAGQDDDLTFVVMKVL